MGEREKLDPEPVRVCPRCGNETSKEILNDIGGCFFCGNPDFSEEAYQLLNYPHRKVNCTACGKLMKSGEAHTFNSLLYRFPKRIKINPFEWVILCTKCDLEVAPTLDLSIIKRRNWFTFWRRK